MCINWFLILLSLIRNIANRYLITILQGTILLYLLYGPSSDEVSVSLY